MATDPRTETITRSAPRWAWETVDALLTLTAAHGDGDMQREAENAKDVLRTFEQPEPAYRVRFVVDEDASFEESNGEPRPLTEAEYAEAEYMKDGIPVPYAEYLEYYGNPHRHVYIGAILERACVCCREWVSAASLWNIDTMDDQPEAGMIGQTFYADRFDQIPGYLREVADELVAEAS